MYRYLYRECRIELPFDTWLLLLLEAAVLIPKHSFLVPAHAGVQRVFRLWHVREARGKPFCSKAQVTLSSKALVTLCSKAQVTLPKAWGCTQEFAEMLALMLY